MSEVSEYKFNVQLERGTEPFIYSGDGPFGGLGD